MARNLKTLKKNTWTALEKASGKARTLIYYGFIPTLLYLGFTTPPKPDIRMILGFFSG